MYFLFKKIVFPSVNSRIFLKLKSEERSSKERKDDASQRDLRSSSFSKDLVRGSQCQVNPWIASLLGFLKEISGRNLTL
jgi:hypothetical protein